MVEVIRGLPLIGATVRCVTTSRRPVPADRLFQMWHTGGPRRSSARAVPSHHPHNELSYSPRGTSATQPFCEGPYEENSRYRDFMGWTVPWYSGAAGLREPVVGNRTSASGSPISATVTRSTRPTGPTGRAQRTDGSLVRTAGSDRLPAGRSSGRKSPGGLAAAMGSKSASFRLDGPPTPSGHGSRRSNDDLGAMPDGLDCVFCALHAGG